MKEEINHYKEKEAMQMEIMHDNGKVKRSRGGGKVKQIRGGGRVKQIRGSGANTWWRSG